MIKYYESNDLLCRTRHPVQTLDDKHPKALALVNGKSLLQRNIEYLQQYGIKDVIVNVHHFADRSLKRLKRIKDGEAMSLISDEREEVLETGGGLVKSKGFIYTRRTICHLQC